ncbi:homeodomain-interacting protein kinase 1-like isoform X4 [Micropterus dolomieu]|uniref:homeodomain-interacting protein kinase 1-like isoform X3 n=1 Tax=Micropterus dolomieu TaxID=147949 RepID=UPI001E8CB738|nr:homeodomain-interacting protein kinase 1-like isoform X3 [Micropterus dolomieu]XP_045901722.1 homeodomain-interacting protein kinase 1-like isoform X4 [Micropterus dolomieu]
MGSALPKLKLCSSIVKNNCVLDESRLTLYLVRGALHNGRTGKVFQCKLFQWARKDVAVKIMHNKFPWSGEKELATLKKLSKLDPDKNSLVRFNRHFKDFQHVYQEYELLDKSLYDFMKVQHFKPLCLCGIRVITQQLLVALNALKSIGLAHSDISPEKVMLVNQLQSFKVKLIGFGAAGQVSTFRHGTTDQCIAYRAPEDLLGLPTNEAIDMWALGCTLAFLYLGQHLYPTESEYEVMRAIVQMQGPPDEHMLKDGGRTSTFFACENYLWRLNDKYENYHRTGHQFTSLDDMAKTRSKVKNRAEYKDTRAFLSLIKQMLQVNPEKRITPSEALEHSFVTMKHFHTKRHPYVRSACLAMEACQLEHSLVKRKPCQTSRKAIGWNRSSITKLDDTLSADDRTEENEPPATADIVTAGTKNTGLPDKVASAGFNDPNYAGTDEKASGTDKAASPAPVSQNSHEGNTNNDEGNTHFVEVKCRKKWLKKIKRFFSRMIKP